MLCLCLAGTVVAEVPNYEYIVDQRTQLDEIAQRTDWVAGSGALRLGYEDDLWIRYRISPNDDLRIFSIDNPWLLAFDVYKVANGNVVQKVETGSTRPLSNRPIASTIFAIPIEPGIDTVYIHDKALSAVLYPVELMTTKEATLHHAQLNTFHGFYYGLVLIMVLYNIALFTATKDPPYLFYSLYAVSLTGLLTSADGSGSVFLWPETPLSQYIMLSLAWGFVFVFASEFVKRYLGLHGREASALRLLQIVAVVTTLIVLATPSPWIYAVRSVISFGFIATIIYVAAAAAYRGSKPGMIFLAATGILAVGAVGHILMIFGIVPPTTLMHHAIHLGSIIELAILAIGLAWRVRDSETQRFEALEQSRELQSRNRELRTARVLAEEHRQLQKSLQQAQKLKTIGQLAGGFAHDFNNILASILGFSELAQVAKAQNDRQAQTRYLGEITKSAERGAALVRQLLVYSRNTPPAPKELNLADTLLQAKELLRGSLPATISLETYLPKEAIYLYSDPEQLQQVLVNLTLNAAEAVNNRGKIDIVLENTSVDNLTCSSCLARFSGNYIAIKVEDSGPGIRGNASDLFTPFNTTKDVGQGTGLGLSVVHGITHEHGGHVHAANKADGGARFVVYLSHEETLSPSPQLDGKRILIIEDDASVASYLEALLDGAHFVPTVKSLPTQALETFMRNPDAYDLVITDHLMPQSTGLELAEDIHALRPDVPVVLTTGNPNNVSGEDLTNSGIAAVFQKPLNSEQLLAKIRALLAVTPAT